MVKPNYLAAIGLSAFMATAGASSYQYEASLDVLSSDVESVEAFGSQLSGKMFLTPIKTGNLPNAEIPFLQKASFVSVGLSSINIDDDSLETTRNVFSLGGNYVQDDWLIGGEIENITISNDFLVEDVTLRFYELKAGRYLSDDWLVSVSLVRASAEESSENGYELASRKVITLSPEYKIAVSGEWFDIEGFRQVILSSDLHIKNDLTVGVSLLDVTLDDSFAVEPDMGFAVHGQYFVKDNFSLRLAISDYDTSPLRGFSFAGDTMILSGSYRF